MVALKDRLNESKLKIDPFNKHYELRVADIDKQIEAQYDKMEDLQDALEKCGSRKKNIKEAHLSSQRIYKILVYFDKLYGIISDEDKQLFFKSLIKEIQIHEEPVGKQWIKSIKFIFPILGEVDEISLNNENTVEPVVLIYHKYWLIIKTRVICFMFVLKSLKVFEKYTFWLMCKCMIISFSCYLKFIIKNC